MTPAAPAVSVFTDGKIALTVTLLDAADASVQALSATTGSVVQFLDDRYVHGCR